MNGFIYVARHRGSGKEYVGLTIRKPDVRWAQHAAAAAAGSQLEFHKVLRIDGAANFVFEVLWEGPVNMLCAQEAKFIRERKTELPYGYNMCPGGRGAPLRTLQTKAMMRCGITNMHVESLTIPKTLTQCKPKYLGGDFCVLSLEEATRLMDWGIWPSCKAHHHAKRSKVGRGSYKILETTDGAMTRLAVPLTEFYKTIEWGWSVQMRAPGPELG